MTQVLISLQGTILIYLFFGFILKKTKIIDQHASYFLSNFILEFILPINILYSCISSFTSDSLYSCFLILCIAVLVEALIYFLTKFKFPYFTNDEMKTAAYGLLVSNGGFIGTPVIEGLYGSLGVMYANVFLIPTRIMAYTAGEGLFNPKKTHGFKQTVLGLLKNRIIIAMLLGILIAAFSIPVPAFLSSALKNVSACMSPLSLILVGSMLAEKMHLDVNEDIKILGLCMIRQFLVPLLLILLLLIIDLDPMIKAIAVLLMGMPVGSTCAIFANKYQSAVGFASKAVFVSTLSSALTLVMLMYFIQCILF